MSDGREIERAVLSAMMRNREARYTAGDVLRVDDFSAPVHGAVYGAILALEGRGEVVDVMTVQAEMAAREGPRLSIAELVDIEDVTLSAASIGTHARLVRSRARLRRYQALFREGLGRLGDAQGDPNAVQEWIDRELTAVTVDSREGGPVRLGDVLTGTLADIDGYRAHDGRVFLPTGLAGIDDMTGGLRPGNLVILAGRPAMGKTSLAMNIVESVAVDRGLPVLVFSLEMSAGQLVERLLCSRARINSRLMQGGVLMPEDYTKLAEVGVAISGSPMYVDDHPVMTVGQIVSRARRFRAQHDVRLVMVDYLQLIAGTGAESRQQDVAAISAALKGMARELNVPVLALSQLNRALEGRSDRRPMLADLRESGAIEQDADMVWFVYRESEYSMTADPCTAEVIVRKNRHGETGTVNLRFDRQFVRFS